MARASNCTRGGRRTWSPTSAGWPAAPSASSPTTRCGSAAAWTPPRRRRRPGSSACATRSACRWWCWWTCPATCRASARSGTGWCAAARVPRITLVLRKTYGGAYIAMNSRALGATKVFAWPGAEIAVMGPVAAIRILHRRTLADVPPDKLHEVEADLAAEHQREAGGLGGGPVAEHPDRGAARRGAAAGGAGLRRRGHPRLRADRLRRHGALAGR